MPDFIGDAGETILTKAKFINNERKVGRTGGPYYLNRLEDPHGRKIVMFTTGREDLSQQFNPGDTFNLYGKIQKHNTYRGEKSTQINRTSYTNPYIIPDNDLEEYTNKAQNVLMGKQEPKLEPELEQESGNWYNRQKSPSISEPEEKLAPSEKGEVKEESPAKEEIKETDPEHVKRLAKAYETAISLGRMKVKSAIPYFLNRVEKRIPSFRDVRKIWENSLTSLEDKDALSAMKSMYRIFEK